MNKRQRKKMFTRAFSKAYDESLKEQKKKRQVSITTVKDKYGKFYIITSLSVGTKRIYGLSNPCDVSQGRIFTASIRRRENIRNVKRAAWRGLFSRVSINLF